MMNGLKKRRGRENPTKMAGPREQGMVKTQLEIVEVGKATLYPHRRSLHCVMIIKFPRQTYENYWTLQPVKLGG